MKVVSEAQITIMDLKDAVTSSTQPVNPITGQLWIDTSTGTSVLKRYTGTEWVKQELNIADLDAVQNKKIQDSYNTLTSMANDGILTYIERQNMYTTLKKLTGLVSVTSSIPTFASLPQYTMYNGEIRSLCLEAVEYLGVTDEDYKDLETKYEYMRTELSKMKVQCYDTTTTVDIDISIAPGIVVWKNIWDNLYKAMYKLREKITKASKAFVNTNITTLKNDYNLVSPLPEGVTLTSDGIVAKVSDTKYARMSGDGLSVVNGALSIRTGSLTESKGVFIDSTGIYANNGTSETVRISNTGNAYFKGEIQATSGSFTGSIKGGSININDNFIVDGLGNVNIKTGNIAKKTISDLIVNPITLSLDSKLTNGNFNGWVQNTSSTTTFDIEEAIFDKQLINTFKISTPLSTATLNKGSGYITSEKFDVDYKKIYSFKSTIRSSLFDYEASGAVENPTGLVEMKLNFYDESNNLVYVERYSVSDGQLSNPVFIDESGTEVYNYPLSNTIKSYTGSTSLFNWEEIETYILPVGLVDSDLTNSTKKSDVVIKMNKNVRKAEIVLETKNNLSMDLSKNATRDIFLTNVKFLDITSNSMVENQIDSLKNSITSVEERITDDSIIRVISNSEEYNSKINSDIDSKIDNINTNVFVKKHEILETIDSTINKFSQHSGRNLLKNSNGFSVKESYRKTNEEIEILDTSGNKIPYSDFTNWKEGIISTNTNYAAVNNSQIYSDFKDNVTLSTKFNNYSSPSSSKKEKENQMGYDSAFYFPTGKSQGIYQEIQVSPDTWYTISYQILKSNSAEGLYEKNTKEAELYSTGIYVYEQNSGYTVEKSKLDNPYYGYENETNPEVYEYKKKKYDEFNFLLEDDTLMTADFFFSDMKTTILESSAYTKYLSDNTKTGYTLISKRISNTHYMNSSYEEVIIHFKPTTSKVLIYMNSKEKSESYITAISLVTGQDSLGWGLSQGESFNTNIQMDSKGISIYEIDEETKERKGYSTIITKDEFSGYYENEKVFYLKEDETYSRKLKTENISLGPISIIEATSFVQNNLFVNGGVATLTNTKVKNAGATTETDFYVPTGFRTWNPDPKSTGITSTYTAAGNALSAIDKTNLGVGAENFVRISCTSMGSTVGCAIDNVYVAKNTEYTVSCRFLAEGTYKNNPKILLGQGTATFGFTYSSVIPFSKLPIISSYSSSSSTANKWYTLSFSFTSASNQNATNLYFGMRNDVLGNGVLDSGKVLMTGFKMEKGKIATKYQNSSLSGDAIKGVPSFEGWVFVPTN